MYIYMKLCSIFNSFFSFSGRREEQRFVLNRIVADLQVFISGSNIRGVADINDRSWPQERDHKLLGWFVNLHCLILSLVTCRILEKDLVLEMFAGTGEEVFYMWQGSG